MEKRRRITEEDIYLACPLQKGQLSCREIMTGEVLLKADPYGQRHELRLEGGVNFRFRDVAHGQHLAGGADRGDDPLVRTSRLA